MRRLNTIGIACAFGIAAMAATSPASAADVTIKAVGTWGNLTNYSKHEGPFWNDVIGKASGGSIKGDIKPQTDLGLKGFEIMRLLKQGVFNYAHGVMGYVSAENAMFDGVDLSSLTQDIETERKVVDAYMPIMAKKFEEIYDSKLMQLYPFPSQNLWCNAEINSIDDLKGKKIRTYTASLADFVQGVGGTSVTVAFAEVIPALQKGVVDCGITGTMPAYNAKWWQVVTHNIRVRVGYAATFTAINMDIWNDFNKETQDLIMSEGKKLEDELWAFESSLDQAGMDCNASGPCTYGEPGGMIPITPSAKDQAMLKDIAENVVLKRWAKRCGKTCTEEWNATVGKVVGLTASE